jgi:hypothetical protein
MTSVLVMSFYATPVPGLSVRRAPSDPQVFLEAIPGLDRKVRAFTGAHQTLLSNSGPAGHVGVIPLAIYVDMQLGIEIRSQVLH